MELSPERLRATRQRRFMTQAELADKAEMTESTINRLEQGVQAPRISTVRKLAKALDVKPEELIDWRAGGDSMGELAA